MGIESESMLSLRNFELLIVMRDRFKEAVPAVTGGPTFTLAPCMAIPAGEVLCAGFSPSSLAGLATGNGERHPNESTVVIQFGRTRQAQARRCFSNEARTVGPGPALGSGSREAQ